MPGDDKPFKVTDKRAFTPEGELKDEAEAAPPPEPRHPEPEPAAAAPSEAIDFTTFLISLAANAMHHLGEGPPEEGGADAPPRKPNLPLARQTIDIVALLQVKTRGNLTGEEERLLEGLLYDLRMRFVAATRRG